MKKSWEASPMEGIEGGDSGGAATAAGAGASEVASQPQKSKPPFRPAEDDTKPILRDPILRSYPIETEEAVLLLPRFSTSS